MIEQKEAGAWGINSVTKITDPVEAMDAANIKMVFDHENRCTYMSRTPIPYPYKALDWSYYKHVGVIGYTLDMLKFYVDSVPGRLEKIEGIDLMRFIDYGKPLYLTDVGACESLSVDTEKDLVEVRRRINSY